MGTKSSKGAETRQMPQSKKAFTNKANGSMDYLAKQDAMASRDISKLHSGAFKDSRYK